MCIEVSKHKHLNDNPMKKESDSIITKVIRRIYDNIPLFLMVVLLNSVYPLIAFSDNGSVGFSFSAGIVFFSVLKTIWMALLSALIAGNMPWIKWIVFLFHLSITEIWLYLGVQFHTRITPFVIALVLQTNASEATEFFHQYFPFSTICVLLFFGILACLLFLVLEKVRKKINELDAKYHRQVSIVTILVSIVSMFVFLKSEQKFVPLDGVRSKVLRLINSSNLPQNDIWLSYKNVEGNKYKVQKIWQANKTIQIDTCFYTSPQIVFIIGESFIKGHSSLYGYNHETNPYLHHEKNTGNLFVFNDVVSYSGATATCMKYFYSTSDASIIDWEETPLFPAVFKKAGYRVALLDNQNTRNNGSAALDYSASFFINSNDVHNQCFDYRNQTTYRYDHEMIEGEKDYLRVDEGPALTIIHLMGQHVDFHLRFPKTDEFVHFSPDSIKRKPYLSEKQCQAICDYDNATLYNDYVLKQIIGNYENADAIVIYLSDHGECVYDDSQLSYGRSIAEEKPLDTIKLMYEIPMMIWCSNMYIQNHPDVVRKISESTDRPYMNDIVSHLLLDLAGVVCPDFNPEKSLINDNYKPVERYVNEGRLNYDLNKKDIDMVLLQTIDN